MSFFNRFRAPTTEGPLPGDPTAAAHEILARAHRDQADAYAATLAPGSTILEDTDGPVIERFRQYLPAALMRRGLEVEPMVGGWRVVGTVAEPRVIRATCRTCGRSWFECEHGINVTVVARW